MSKFTKDKVLLLHQLMAEATGGAIGVRDMDLLESALESVYSTFDGVELYPTKEEKAAKLGFSLISNNAFLDGNKRIGIFVIISFLELNGISLIATDEDVISLGMNVASGVSKYDDVLRWIKEHRM